MVNSKIQAAEENLIHVYNRFPIVLDHGEGMYLYDTEGKEYLDFAAGFAVCGLGYGNRELNEALVSRFLVIDMPELEEETLMRILRSSFPEAKEEGLRSFAGLFLDLQLKASNSEISTKPLDLRGLIGALKTVRCGLKPRLAVTMGITNKSFDMFEKEIVGDIVMTRIPEDWTAEKIF